MKTKNFFGGLKSGALAAFIAGPAAGVILPDLGADVIKVEPPQGELWRIANKIPPQPISPEPYQWHLNNRNKRGVALDLKASGAAKILRRMVEWADVLIVNTPHAARKKLGLEYEDVAPWNPRLIYADLTGFGERGRTPVFRGFTQ